MHQQHSSMIKEACNLMPFEDAANIIAWRMKVKEIELTRNSRVPGICIRPCKVDHSYDTAVVGLVGTGYTLNSQVMDSPRGFHRSIFKPIAPTLTPTPAPTHGRIISQQ